MKKTQLYGIVAIALAVLLAIPTLLAAFGVAGFDVTYMDILEDLNFDLEFMGVLMQIGLILTLIAAVCLVVYGVLLLLNKEGLLKYNMIITVVAGALALVTFLATLLYCGDMGTVMGIKITADVGIGAILFGVFGAISIASSFVLKAIKK